MFQCIIICQKKCQMTVYKYSIPVINIILTKILQANTVRIHRCIYPMLYNLLESQDITDLII